MKQIGSLWIRWSNASCRACRGRLIWHFHFKSCNPPQYVSFTYEFAFASRVVNIGMKSKAPVDSWMGWSSGSWDGDTLVVDVTGQVEDTWFDRAGDYHSDALHVVERYTPTSQIRFSTKLPSTIRRFIPALGR